MTFDKIGIDLSSHKDIIERHGGWTAMSIHLGNGQYTLMPPQADRRLRRFLQTAADLAGKPLDQLRVLDLACLEGHYALEFAKHGARVVGIEIREANIEKSRYAQRCLGLTNAEFVQDDVRNLSRAKYGGFDVVICAGILYHLPARDVIHFVQSIYDVCDRIAIFDTHFALCDKVPVNDETDRYWGLYYVEHDESATPEQKAKDVWASIDNTTSFWFTHASLCNIFDRAGFTSVYECLNPSMPSQNQDRKTYVAIKGSGVVRVLTSPPTDDEVRVAWPEHRPWRVNPIHRNQNTVRRFFKRILPQPLKNLIKPILRACRLLEPDPTPAWAKRNFPQK